MFASHESQRRICMLLFLTPLCLGIYQWYRHPLTLGGGYEPANVARSLVERGAFADPFGSVVTGPSAHLAPAFPFFLAGLMLPFGYTLRFAVSAVVIEAAMHGLHAVLLPRLSKLFLGSATPGYWAALLFVLLPAVQFLPGWEAIYFADGLMLFCLASAWLLRSGRGALANGLACGAICGVLCLLNPVAPTVCFSWIVILLVWRRVDPKRAAMILGGLVLATMLVCFPWNLRNYRVFHRWFWIRDNFGQELYHSNNDLASSSDDVNNLRGLHHAMQLHSNPPEAARMRRMNEVEYYRQRMAIAVDWIRRHPSRFAVLTAQRALEFWFPNPTLTAASAYSIWAITLLSLPGLVLMVARKFPVTWFIGLVFAFYPLIYYLVQSSARFRYPILWLSLLPAGYCLERTVQWGRDSMIRRVSRDASPGRFQNAQR
jgi:hypothetical protein